MLKRALVPRETRDEPGAGTTFFLAAVSKVVATAMTYPFPIAKARVQVPSAPEGERAERDGNGEHQPREGYHFCDSAEDSEGGRGGGAVRLGGELLKGFFSHGTTMLSKDVIHRFVVQFYFAILVALRRLPQVRARLSELMREARREM